jgi:tetratricopeptide (TPR) repeat protein
VQAEREYQAARKLAPDGILAPEHLAELRVAQRRYDEAIALYRKVLARVPRPEFWAALGDVYAAKGRLAEAKEWHARALAGYLESVERGEVAYYRDLARYYSDTAPDPPRALEWAQKDLEIRPNAESHHVLAWALYRAGDFASAARAIRQALAPGTQDAELHFHAGMIFTRSGDPERARVHLRRSLSLNPRLSSAAEARRALAALPAARPR